MVRFGESIRKACQHWALSLQGRRSENALRWSGARQRRECMTADGAYGNRNTRYQRLGDGGTYQALDSTRVSRRDNDPIHHSRLDKGWNLIFGKPVKDDWLTPNPLALELRRQLVQFRPHILAKEARLDERPPIDRFGP